MADRKSASDLQLMRVESKGVFAVRDILAQFERLTNRAQRAEQELRRSREHSIELERIVAEMSHSLTDLTPVLCTPKNVRRIVDKAVNFKKYWPLI